MLKVVFLFLQSCKSDLEKFRKHSEEMSKERNALEIEVRRLRPLIPKLAIERKLSLTRKLEISNLKSELQSHAQVVVEAVDTSNQAIAILDSKSREIERQFHAAKVKEAEAEEIMAEFEARSITLEKVVSLLEERQNELLAREVEVEKEESLLKRRKARLSFQESTVKSSSSTIGEIQSLAGQLRIKDQAFSVLKKEYDLMLFKYNDQIKQLAEIRPREEKVEIKSRKVVDFGVQTGLAWELEVEEEKSAGLTEKLENTMNQVQRKEEDILELETRIKELEVDVEKACYLRSRVEELELQNSENLVTESKLREILAIKEQDFETVNDQFDKLRLENDALHEMLIRFADEAKLSQRIIHTLEDDKVE